MENAALNLMCFQGFQGILFGCNRLDSFVICIFSCCVVVKYLRVSCSFEMAGEWKVGEDDERMRPFYQNETTQKFS